MSIATTYHRLGNYIREVNVRNTDLAVTKLLGLSVDKKFIPSIANTIGTDMSTYKIVSRRQFVYIADTSRRGDKIAVALLSDADKAIISSIYTVFEITDNEKLLPEYLMMWFRRPEFDRYARYKSHGSAREIFDWDEMCNIELPIPSIAQQQRIVDEYETLTRRIRLNEQLINKLEETAQTLYRKMFVDGIDKENLPEGWKMGTLGDVAEITMGQSPEGESYNENGIGEIFYQGRSDFGYRFPSIRVFTTNPTRMANIGDILLSVRAPVGDLNIAPLNCCIGRGLSAIRSKIKCNAFVFYLLQTKKNDFNISNDDGTVFGSINKDDLHALAVIIPQENDIITFDNYASKVDKQIIFKQQENEKIKELQSLLLAKMGRK